VCTVIFDAVDVFEEFYILVKNHKVERRIGTRAFRFYVALAYLPAEKEKSRPDHTILPMGLKISLRDLPSTTETNS
jgi:hypothetical protein